MNFPISGDRSWSTAFRAARNVPADFAAVVAFVVVVDVVTLASPFEETMLRPLLALPLLFFVPGYALLAALFPRRAVDGRENRSGFGGRRIDWVERLALSVGASVALLPLVGVALSLASWPITTSTVVLALGGFAVVGMAVATVRRFQVPPESRFRIPYGQWIERGRAAMSGSRRDVVLNVALATSVVLATGGLAYAVTAPDRASSYTEFAVLSESETGDLVSSGHPGELTAGEPTELAVGIENYEGEPVDYTVVVAVERVETGDGDPTVVEREQLDQVTVSVQPGETVHERHDVAPTMTGEDLRVSYYLYRGEPPENPSEESAYHHLFFWADVTDEE